MSTLARRASSRRGVSSGTTLELAKATLSRRKKVPVEREYVGIDLHRRRSVIVRKNASGELLSKTHIDNDPVALMTAVAEGLVPNQRWWSRPRSAGIGPRMC
jgi:hypothetical protein